MDVTWYVRVVRVRTEDNRWRRLVSSPDPQVRAARNRPAPPAARGPVVAVTGAASGVGDLLTRRLVASGEVRQVVAVDERRGEVPEALWHTLDVRDPAIAERLRGADVVVHLAIDLDLETDPAARTAYNVRGTQTVLTAAAAAGVRRVVLCTSAMVYGALPDNDVPLSEDAELRATAEATGVGDLLEIERLARRAPARTRDSTSPSCAPPSSSGAPTPP